MRKRGSTREKTSAAIRKASLELIYEKGFDGMSLRDLAKKVGLQPASIYNYIDEKEDILFFLVHDTLLRRIEEIRTRLDEVGPDPKERIQAFVQLMVEFHTRRRREMTVGNQEIKSLSKARYRKIVKVRDQFEHVLTDAIEAGCKANIFRVDNIRLATFAIITMISGISGWYSPKGPLQPEEIAQHYERMVLSMLGFTGPPA